MKPSALYRAELWQCGQWLAQRLPPAFALRFATAAAGLYWHLRKSRRETVTANLLPALGGDRRTAELAGRQVFREFARKLYDLWRYESGLPVTALFHQWTNWDIYQRAQARGLGVLLLTPHLGNWELGGPLLARQGVRLQVISLAEPTETLTRLRQRARARWGIETLIIGENPFAFLDVIRALENGATVALLIDRPRPSNRLTVQFFGRPFHVSGAAGELARATGCALLPVYLPRTECGYDAHILPEIAYDRSALRDRDLRRQLAQEIMRAFEPVVRQYIHQWYHFVPIWPELTDDASGSLA